MRGKTLRQSLPGASTLGYFARLYQNFLKVCVLANIQYRASGVIWMIGSILEPTIYLVVWSTVANTKGGEVGGFTTAQFAAYYIVLMIVNHLTFSWVMQVFQFRIQYGQLSFELMRPIHPIHFDITDNLAFKLVQMTVMLPAFGILILLFEPQFDISLKALLTAIPIILLAFAVRFCLEWTLALAAFWTTRITAINNTYFGIMMFLSGRVAPIALLPLWLQPIAHTLPFYYVVAFPVEVILGRVEGAELVSGVIHLFGWLTAALLLLRFVWTRAIRSYGAVGG